MGQVVNERIEIADADYECNACHWLQSYLDENSIDTKLRFSEWRAYIRARKNGCNVKKGDPVRIYEWIDTDYIPEPWEITTSNYEVSTCYEIPEIAAICTRLDLWP
jgi:hypothetical protein